MTKNQFLEQLRIGLSSLPLNETEERLSFYSEIIDDRIDEGISEEEAVLSVGNIEDIIAQSTEETIIIKKSTASKKSLSVWVILLLILGSPIWLSLLITVIAVIVSVYISLWSVIISLWSIFASFIAVAVGCIICGIGFLFLHKTLLALAVIGVGIVFAGLSIFAFYGCKITTKGILLLTKKIALTIKNRFSSKEKVQ